MCMNDLGPILELWRALNSTGADYVLATILRVEGPSYRKPGARMIIAADGRRTGTISGGCLEDDVARRASWLAKSGPVIEQFSTMDDDGERPYGSGCGGLLHILLEGRQTAAPLLQALDEAYRVRNPLAIATTLSGSTLTRALAHAPSALPPAPEETIEYAPARTGLWIFGAGNDALPLLRIAHELGYYVALADGRSHLATAARFSLADAVYTLAMDNLPAAPLPFAIKPSDAILLMTHSFEQDARLLAALIQSPPIFHQNFIGVLGPKRRTRELLVEAAQLLGLHSKPAQPLAAQIDTWLAQLHSPVGLDLGAADPASIAISILAEIEHWQKKQRGIHTTTRPLHEVR